MMVPELTPFGSNSLGQDRRSPSANASFDLLLAVPQATQSSEELGLPMTLDLVSDGNRVSSRETATADGLERAQVGRSGMAPVPRGPRDAGFWAVIPAGGAGTRLWPLSRAARPKFLLPLTGSRSLLQQTVDRLAPLAPPKNALVVCGLLHAVPVARQLPDVPDANIVIEPAPKGSGPAIGLAAALIARQDPHAIMGSFAADHDVRDDAAFVRAIRAAIAAASEGNLVTVGIAPTRPETGYGYVERTDEVVAETADGVTYRAAGFHEKPDETRAKEYVAGGRHLWNASMFVWRVDAILAELERLQPELHAAVREVAAAWGTPEQDRVATDVWASLPVSTIDEGVLEPSAAAGRVAVVPADLGWSDVGDWHGLGEMIERDALGNSVRGDLIQVETRDSIVWSETGRPVALLGLENVVVVDTADVLLVSARGRAQEVRQLVERLKALKRHELR